MFLFLLLPMSTFYIFLETFVGFSNLWPDRGTVLRRRGDAAWSSGRQLWVVPGPLLRAAVSPREAQSPSGPSPSGSSSFSASMSILPSAALAEWGPGEGGSCRLGSRSSAASVSS